jgi:alkanesulfonate monooxygenase SsuD/methylene tetrahydromethanopterin reductase-like flavin-dependent oxidoreductase (luciferase family)
MRAQRLVAPGLILPCVVVEVTEGQPTGCRCDAATGPDRGHPPVILGGAFPWAARRAIRYGDGWYPNAASGNPEEYLPAFCKIAQLRSLLA